MHDNDPVIPTTAGPRHEALERIRSESSKLRNGLRLPWPDEIEQAVSRRLVDFARSRVPSGEGRLGTSRSSGGLLPPLIAVVGGASAGKSTVFNNLLGGGFFSRVAPEAHTTSGLILAAHEASRADLLRLAELGGFLGCARFEFADAARPQTGRTDALTIVFHAMDPFRGVWLIDTPDFTSESARREGDVTLKLLPWFDRLLVVLDSERWFDRQSVSRIHESSRRWGHDRFVLFNRTCEGVLAESDLNMLKGQASRLDATGMSILEFRRGRGLVEFAPGALDDASRFLLEEPQNRNRFLSAEIAKASRRLLNQNDERLSRLGELQSQLRAATDRILPSEWDCMTAIMVPTERRQLEIVSRVLRLNTAGRWLSDQRRRLGRMVKSLYEPASPQESVENSPAEGESEGSRIILAEGFFRRVAARHAHDLTRLAHGARFWSEVRSWTGLESAGVRFEWDEVRRESVRRRTGRLDQALRLWNARVESECEGVGPHMKGAAVVGLVATAVVLIAVPGPLTALSVIAAKGALAGAMSHVLGAAGLGAILGKNLTRLVEVVREKLIGSPEFNEVLSAAGEFRAEIAAALRSAESGLVAEAQALTLPTGDPLHHALCTVADHADLLP